MIAETEKSRLRDQLRGLRVDPPAEPFKMRLRARLEVEAAKVGSGPQASGVIPFRLRGVALSKRRRPLLLLAAAALLAAGGAAATNAPAWVARWVGLTEPATSVPIVQAQPRPVTPAPRPVRVPARTPAKLDTTVVPSVGAVRDTAARRLQLPEAPVRLKVAPAIQSAATVPRVPRPRFALRERVRATRGMTKNVKRAERQGSSVQVPRLNVRPAAVDRARGKTKRRKPARLNGSRQLGQRPEELRERLREQRKNRERKRRRGSNKRGRRGGRR